MKLQRVTKAAKTALTAVGLMIVVTYTVTSVFGGLAYLAFDADENLTLYGCFIWFLNLGFVLFILNLLTPDEVDHG